MAVLHRFYCKAKHNRINPYEYGTFCICMVKFSKFVKIILAFQNTIIIINGMQLLKILFFENRIGDLINAENSSTVLSHNMITNKSKTYVT